MQRAGRARFAAVARVSEIGQGIYATAVQPYVRQMVTKQSAEWMRQLHPHRLRFSLFSDRNPLLRGLPEFAAAVQQQRRPVPANNPLMAAEHMMSDWIIQGLDLATEWRDALQEAVFTATFGAPMLQAMVGLLGEHAVTARHAERDLMRETAEQHAIAAAAARIDSGGAVAAAVRALLWVLHPVRRIDEREFATMRSIAAELPPSERVGAKRFKEIVHEQYLALLAGETQAFEALPRMLPASLNARIIDALRRVFASGDPLPAAAQARLAQVEALLGGEPEPRPAERAPRELVGE